MQELRRIIKGFLVVWDKSDLDLISAGVAFYGMFSIFPAVAACIAIFSLVADPVVIEQQLALLQDVIPADAYTLFEDQITRLLSAPSAALGWATLVSVGIALWSARAGVGALMRGLNQIEGVPARSGLRHFGVAILLTISLIGVSLVALAMVVVAPIVLAFVPLEREWTGTINTVRWAVALFVLLAALGIFYRFGPNSKDTGRTPWLSPGAVLTVALWFAASWGFSTYLTNFGNYNEIYGSIGAVIAMLMWLYISSFLVLLGAAINVALRAKHAYPLIN